MPKKGLKRHTEELEDKLKSLTWQERKASAPDATHTCWGQFVELHQFSALDDDRQVFVYRTSNKYNGSDEKYDIYGLALFKARKSMAEYFQPEGVTIWEGSFARPNSEGLIAHEEESDDDSLIRQLFEKLRISQKLKHGRKK